MASPRLGKSDRMSRSTTRALAWLFGASLLLTAALLARPQLAAPPAASMSALLSSLRDATGYADAPLPPPALGTCDDAEAAAAAAAAAPSPWTEGCLRLEDACVDNGGILLYSKRDRSREPFEVQPSEDRIKYDGRTLQVPIRVRGALEGPPTVEGAAYLRAPAFSRCTVPVVWYSMW